MWVVVVARCNLTSYPEIEKVFESNKLFNDVRHNVSFIFCFLPAEYIFWPTFGRWYAQIVGVI